MQLGRPLTGRRHFANSGARGRHCSPVTNDVTDVATVEMLQLLSTKIAFDSGGIG